MCCVIFNIREIQTLFVGHKYTVIAVSLVHYKSFLRGAVICDLVLLFNVVQRQNIRDVLWVVPNRNIAFRSPLRVIIALQALQYRVSVCFESLILVSRFLFEKTPTVDWLSSKIQLEGIPALSYSEHITSFFRKAKPS